MNFHEYIVRRHKLVLDGPMGTELHHRGINIELPLWSAAAIQTHPQTICEIHTDYIKAGADIITTNTFRTDSRTFRKAGLSAADARRATLHAVDLARKAIARYSTVKKIWLAGSMSPLEDCYRPDLAPPYDIALAEHREKAGWLADGGVDFILIETMNSITEAEAAAQAALETGLPVAVSFILSDKDKLFNSEKVSDALNRMTKMGVQILSINCCHHSIITGFLRDYFDKISLPLMVYPNAGYYDPRRGWQTDPAFTPQIFSAIAKSWFEAGVQIVGGCCETGPDYIRHIRKEKSGEGTPD
ncbi:MAG TPA: homocysteine S-methyltransferase family protein [Candidatus Marinimicrobia bacterium]|nr:homocysteine S-methyltransferase family protein [Candidatus Neomarinimicrobiota bacterium]